MKRKLIAIDCETDPFKAGRVPEPFIWGMYDGNEFKYWRHTEEFVEWLSGRNVIAYAHNGGKFDFMYLFNYIEKTRARIIGGRFAEMQLGNAKLRDSYSIIPVPLAAIQKDEIDYNKMEREVREQYMKSDIIPYLKTDCKVLWEAVNAYRIAAGKSLTIASNAMASSKKLRVDPGKTNYRFDTEFREYYFGGRTQCFQPGTHENLRVVDIVSSYPYAMSRDHATGTDRASNDRMTLTDEREIGRSFIKLECYSEGAFPLRKKDGGLDFPHGFHEFSVTGWEYLTALKHKLISRIKINRVVTFENTINFSPYIEKWFKHKQDHPKKTDPINYTIGKIMMNSCAALRFGCAGAA